MNINQPWDVLRFKGTGSWNSIAGGDGVAVVDNETLPYTVKLETGANHNLTIGSHITIADTTNYNGTFEVLTGSATKYIYIAHKYIAENLTTNAKFKITLAPGVPFEFGGFRLHFGSGAASADLTIGLDAGAGDVYDTNIYTLASATITTKTDVILDWTDEPMPFLHKDDELDFAYVNTQTFGLEVLWRRLS